MPRLRLASMVPGCRVARKFAWQSEECSGDADRRNVYCIQFFAWASTQEELRYCVAPIIDDSKPEKIQFWAAGQAWGHGH